MITVQKIVAYIFIGLSLIAVFYMVYKVYAALKYRQLMLTTELPSIDDDLEVEEKEVFKKISKRVTIKTLKKSTDRLEELNIEGNDNNEYIDETLTSLGIYTGDDWDMPEAPEYEIDEDEMPIEVEEVILDDNVTPETEAEFEDMMASIMED